MLWLLFVPERYMWWFDAFHARSVLIHVQGPLVHNRRPTFPRWLRGLSGGCPQPLNRTGVLFWQDFHARTVMASGRPIFGKDFSL